MRDRRALAKSNRGPDINATLDLSEQNLGKRSLSAHSEAQRVRFTDADVLDTNAPKIGMLAFVAQAEREAMSRRTKRRCGLFGSEVARAAAAKV